jgi:ferredoxin-type protein NapH
MTHPRTAAPASDAVSRRADVTVDAVRVKGWWRAHRFLLLRRATQLGLLALFLAGPLAGVWIVKGNLSSSLTLGVLPLTDPFVLAQTLAAGHLPETAALVGAAIVVAFYALAGGRAFCSWVCPVNPVTDAAAWMRRRLRIDGGRPLRAPLRNALLAAILVACAFSGRAVWEAVNPVSLTHRAIVFGGLAAWTGVAAVFLFDLFVAPRGWCGGLCPVGAAYGLVGRKALVRVSARRSNRCNDCAACYAVCPEPAVIVHPLKGRDGSGPQILDPACTNCGRCVDVCAPDVFRFTHRFDHRRERA